ncbi:hypothetical protein SM11_pC1337 (plasmid) [Sinorhizobium meliloti SM11]|uniref:Uncharacterized protein n=1 Tax=Sinorhizobium meliloti (strain SM11) TaxID=707241 RepID=F7XB11_SINMM|nr:hypothetical protein SM11_pC1337 [Sinorhizobium meliloti SM11]
MTRLETNASNESETAVENAGLFISISPRNAFDYVL